MPEHDTGPLFVIGGHEDKEGDRVILRAFAEAVDGGRVVLATVATDRPEGYVESYRAAFDGLPIGDLADLHFGDRTEADDEALAVLDGAGGVFFTGGDQRRIMRRVAGTPVERALRDLWEKGGALAGTSAGAAVMGDPMLVRGPSDSSYRVGELELERGLGLVPGVVIDQHFAERGRIGRLLGAVGHHPRLLGVGIDEDTAVVVRGERFHVLGSGAVYVVDGSSVSGSNEDSADADEALSVFDVRLHVLSAGDGFHLADRRPEEAAARIASAGGGRRG